MIVFAPVKRLKIGGRNGKKRFPTIKPEKRSPKEEY